MRNAPRILCLAFVAYLGASILGFPGCSRIPYTCAVCRKERVDKSVLGFKSSYQEDTDCSLWYQGHIEPTHTHSWVEKPHCRRFGIPGLYSGYACSAGGSPITGLSRIVQMQVYKHFGDPIAAKQLFIRLGQWREKDINGTLDNLMQWVNEDCPGTWRDWLEKHREPKFVLPDPPEPIADYRQAEPSR
jgi:hypothetical protein